MVRKYKPKWYQHPVWNRIRDLFLLAGFITCNLFIWFIFYMYGASNASDRIIIAHQCQSLYKEYIELGDDVYIPPSKRRLLEEYLKKNCSQQYKLLMKHKKNI